MNAVFDMGIWGCIIWCIVIAWAVVMCKILD